MDYITILNQIRSKLPSPSSSSTSGLPTLPWLGNPELGIVCGSGLNLIKNVLEDLIEIEYGDLDGFVTSTVNGHQSSLAFGYLRTGSNPYQQSNQSNQQSNLKPIPVVCQLGRFHAYEGHHLNTVTYPIKVFKALGVKTLILTNAAGALNPNFNVGDIMVLRDHIGIPSLALNNPLIGPNIDDLGPRFLPMSDAYDFSYRKSLFRATQALNFDQKGIEVHEGCYAWVSGPTYETRTEASFLKGLGADVVGMSTVPEVVVGRHGGLRILALSLITNKVIISSHRSAKDEVKEEMKKFGNHGDKGGGDEVFVKNDEELETEEGVANHQEVLEVSSMRAKDLRDLVQKFVEFM